MRESEMAALLTAAAAIDGRRLEGAAGEAMLAAWMQAVGHLGYQECLRALAEHRRSSTEWLLPAHIHQLVMAGRQERPFDPVEAERAALDEFVAYTGVQAAVAAARWDDEEWKGRQIDEARRAHWKRATGGQA